MEYILKEKIKNLTSKKTFLKSMSAFLSVLMCFGFSYPEIAFGQSSGNELDDAFANDETNRNTDDSLFPETDSSSYVQDQNGGEYSDLYGQSGNYSVPEINTDSQAYQAQYGAEQEQIDYQLGRVAAEGIAGCSITGFFTNLIKSALGLAELKVDEALSLTEVPVTSKDIRILRAKETSAFAPLGFPVLGSWDQIGWCLVNIFIDYLGQATVDWINGGFQGNPVFVDNPGQFFRDIADIEAGKIIQGLGGGFLCEPFRISVTLGLLNDYNRGYGNRACTLSRIVENIEGFANGDFSQGGWDGWFHMTQYAPNNPYGSRYETQRDLEIRIASAYGEQRINLDWGNGFLSFKDPETGKTTTPGRIIDQQINQRLFNGERRLLIADEFDEIIDALVNQLVKVALNEVLQARN